MATKRVVIDIDVDESGAVTSIKNVGAELDKVKGKSKDVKKETSGVTQIFETAFPKAAGAVKGVTAAISGLTSGFKLLRGALISTGIGALVVAIGSLIAYFTQTKRGAELLQRALAPLKAIFALLTDAASALGEGIVNAFQNPKQTISDLWEFIKSQFWNRILALQLLVEGFGKTLMAAFTLDWDGVKEGAEKTTRAFIQLQTGFDTDQQNKFIDGLKEMGTEMANAARKAYELEAAQQRLDDLNRKLSVSTARARAMIKEFNLVAEDTTRTYEERITAASKANTIEQKAMAARVAAAEEELRIIREKNALSESGAKDLDREAEAEIALYAIRQESLELQTTLGNKLNALNRERNEKARQAREKAAEEERKIAEDLQAVREALITDATEKELYEIDKKYSELMKKAHGNAELEKQLTEQRLLDIKAIEDRIQAEKDKEQADRDAAEKERQAKLDAEAEAARQAQAQKEIDDYRKLQDSKRQLAATTIDAISTLADLAAGDDEKRARKAFAITRALNLAQAIANTYNAITAVLSDKTLPTTAKPFAIASAVGQGLAAVAKIAATKFGGGASGGAGGGGGLGSVGQAPAATAVPTLDLGLNGQQQQTPIPAYVIGQQVQNDMEARTRVQDLARL